MNWLLSTSITRLGPAVSLHDVVISTDVMSGSVPTMLNCTLWCVTVPAVTVISLVSILLGAKHGIDYACSKSIQVSLYTFCPKKTS